MLRWVPPDEACGGATGVSPWGSTRLREKRGCESTDESVAVSAEPLAKADRLRRISPDEEHVEVPWV